MATINETRIAMESANLHNVIVETKSGARYMVNYDQIHPDYIDENDDGFVYGTRINASLASRFKRGRGAMDGDVRWFYLKNVKIIEAVAP